MDLKMNFIACNISENHTLRSGPSNEINSLVGCIGDDIRIEYEKKIKAFKNMLKKQGKDAEFQSLAMVDAIQRLGVEHLFQEEIDATLQGHHMMMPKTHNDTDLHEVALRFRLLRQEGYYVPAGVFDRFKGEDGKFKKELTHEIKGLMALYEASQLRIEGEDILDEAGDYSYQLLHSYMTSLDYPEASAIEHTLKHPHYKSHPMFFAKHFITNLQGANGWMNELQELAKFDFTMVQSQHQQEILRISEWWKELGLNKELKFARDQPLKWWTWSMTALTDPSLSEQRIDLVKPISFVYMIDDIFDVYGTLDDLTLFTQVVDRWDIAATEQLPDYMRICFNALDNVTNEISFKVYKRHGWNPLLSLRKTWASLCNAFLEEAKWFASGDLPNSEEYLKNGNLSSGVHAVLVHLFFLLGEGITKENVELIDANPGIINSTARILRLWDDLGSAKDENQDGYDGSYVECYLKEHQGCSVESARKHVHQMISETWKQLNKECLFQNPFSLTFTKACLNVARMVPLMYSYDENHRLLILEEHISSLLHESVSM
ncbi:probable terpene synthase 13 [Hevea brasiliensis]|nr:probable terpene synthase 13 [Hevea brasiliensis]